MALLFDVIEDTRDETGQALAAAVVVVGRMSSASSCWTLLRVLCFWMVACTEHLQRHNGQDNAVADYRFAEHEELLAYIASSCRVRVRRRFLCWIEVFGPTHRRYSCNSTG